MRIALGNVSIRLASWARSLSMGLLALFTLALVVAGIAAAFGSALPEPFEGTNQVGFGTYAWEALVMMAVVFVGGRLLLFWLFVSLSQLAYPAEYKAEMDRHYREATETLDYPP